MVEEATGAFVTPEPFEEIERRDYDDTEIVFLKLAQLSRQRRPNSRSISVSFSST